MGDTSSAKGHSSRTGTMLDSPGPLGSGPQYEKTPGILGSCDQLDPTFNVKVGAIEKDERKRFIKERFEDCVKKLAVAIRFTKEKTNTIYCKANIKEFFKIPDNDDKALLETAKNIIEVLEKIQAKMTNCDLIVEVNEPGAGIKWAIWVRQNVYKDMDKDAEPMARAMDGKIVLYYPSFFNDSNSNSTLIHEFAHLVGITGDIYYDQEGWENIKDNKAALAQADTYARYAVEVANYAEAKKIF